MNIFKGQNLLEFSERFKTDDNCKEYLANIKWKNGFECVKCSNKTTYTYKYSLPEGITYEWVYIPTGGVSSGSYHSHFDAPHGPSIHPDNHPNEIIIDPAFLNSKAGCVFNKLLETGVTNYHNMITELFIEFGEGNIGSDNITFKMSSNLPNNVGGKTSTDKEGNYYIEINSNLMNTLSSIEVAAILIHEISHAFLGKHYNNSYATFKVIYQQYINDNGLDNYSHDIMKDYFINRMANVLYNYDSTIFSNYEDYKILSSQGVYELSTDELRKLSDVKIKSRTNDTNCK